MESMSGHNMDMMMTTSASMAMGATGTAVAPMASSTGSMGGMGGGMGMGGGSKCKISMLWNWYTVDTCFLSSSWHNTSKGMFAGSCIGVILLVVVLEALRRAGKEYDRYIVAQHAKSLASSSSHVVSSASSANGTSKTPVTTAEPACTGPVPAQHFRPSVMQQAVRALLHMLQFAVAYFVMLLAMYYNGYIIISIFIGAYIGYFIFGWEGFNVSRGGTDRMQENATVCCG